MTELEKLLIDIIFYIERGQIAEADRLKKKAFEIINARSTFKKNQILNSK